jgi:hypothetical protein
MDCSAASSAVPPRARQKMRASAQGMGEWKAGQEELSYFQLISLPYKNFSGSSLLFSDVLSFAVLTREPLTPKPLSHIRVQ